ncbi:MAG TPA: sulfotransferase [Anaerolineales bacterium]|nr:sulfotransferase [Anaerolineales bacterium]
MVDRKRKSEPALTLGQITERPRLKIREYMDLAQHRFIFVCGLHRSGTSVLFRSLREHPQVSGFQGTASPEDEGMHLQTVYLPSGHYGGAGEFGFHPEAHLTESSSLVTDANRQKLLSERSRYWDLSKTYLLEKSPPNIIRTRFLQAMCPNSYFIIMLRHPLAVSYATQKWYRKYKINWRGFPRIFEHWLVCNEIFRADQKHLKHSFVVKYEEFVADPHKWISDIYRFLGLSEFSMNQEIISGANNRYFELWQRKHSGFFSGRMNRKIVEQYEERVRCFGYSLIDLNWIGPILD